MKPMWLPLILWATFLIRQTENKKVTGQKQEPSKEQGKQELKPKTNSTKPDSTSGKNEGSVPAAKPANPRQDPSVTKLKNTRRVDLDKIRTTKPGNTR